MPIKPAWGLAALCVLRTASAEQVAANTLADLTLEQLANIEVTSVSGRAQSLRSAAASIYVITAEDIRRSAATSLPEVLRLAPNLQVARLNSGQYAISARGFNNAIANKLLVLVDGRTIYSTLFSGVFWDFHDVVLEDVERIEIVSGPGGTLWGANAVNGIINVVTKGAGATQGVLVSATRADSGGSTAARWGGQWGGAHVRAYALQADRQNTKLVSGVERLDASAKKQLGFRADWDDLDGGAQFTLQGDAFEAGKLPSTNLAPEMRGANLLARWDVHRPDGSSWRLQAFADHYRRDETTAFRNTADNLDVQFSHEPAMKGAHRVLWGAGVHAGRDRNDPSALTAFVPVARTMRWWNVFVQDQIALGERTQATLGVKAERNGYTGLEWMPSARVAYTHANDATTWAAVSRAVRAPSRIDRDFFVPGVAPFVIAGGPSFQSEVANVVEAGHRGGVGRDFSYDATVFRQSYRGLRGGTNAAPTQIANRIEGHVEGLEAWANWQVRPFWRLSAGYLRLNKSLAYSSNPPATAATGIANLGNDPGSQWSLRSQLDLGRGVAFDVFVRRVGGLPAPLVPAYTAVHARLAWAVRPGLEVSLLGHNVLDPGHVEFNAPGTASVFRRRVFAKAVWTP